MTFERVFVAAVLGIIHALALLNSDQCNTNRKANTASLPLNDAASCMELYVWCRYSKWWL